FVVPAENCGNLILNPEFKSAVPLDHNGGLPSDSRQTVFPLSFYLGKCGCLYDMILCTLRVLYGTPSRKNVVQSSNTKAARENSRHFPFYIPNNLATAF
ncbi:hypothetical protein V1477_020844, partial [Vespula maculifrons]